MSTAADSNLLFGILALQMDFISRDQLIAAMNAWVLDKTKSLGEILATHGVLSPERLGLLTGLMAEHLKQHGNDPAQSLAAVSSLGSAKKDLQQIADADVQVSLGVVGSARADEVDPFATRPQPTMGQPTSDGLRFRILRPHAEGGLGRVSVAEDGELHREVALKEIKDKFADHPESRARFVVEAEITGGLEHPGIVPVYGLGTYADGRPFYAMRFIRGDSLKEAIKRFHDASSPRFDSLEFRRLLGRFVDVCNAIAYAHSRKVLHRDLKPGNIMLGKYGETLVVDWGLAKAAGKSQTVQAGSASDPANEPSLHPASASGTDETLPGQAIGTPEFMSPEQAAGRIDLMGPPTDIYSLGATLYAILTGRPPVTGTNVAEVLRNVERGEIAPPRSVVAGVPAALAAVCMKAMALKAVDRYESALDLAKDVERWLADEPVTAWREPFWPRLRRWVRKHARLVTGLAAALVVGLAALGLATWQSERARLAIANKEAETAKERDAKEAERATAAAERDRALAARKRTREALDVMVSGVTGDSLTTQTAISGEQKKFLNSVLTYYQEFAAEPGEDREGRERLAEAHARLGLIRCRLGQSQEGAPVVRRAAELYEKLAADFPAVPKYRSNLAGTRNSLGFLLNNLGNHAEAESAYRAALAIREKLAADFPAVPEYRSDLAVSHNNLGLTLAALGNRAGAESAYRAALAIQEKLAADFPAEPKYHSELARSHNNLGGLLNALGNRAGAESAFRAALAIQEKLAADFPAVPAYRSELATSHYNLGIVLAALGNRAGAESAWRAALAIREKLAADFPAVPEYRSDLASSHFNLGSLLYDFGNRAGAESAWRAALVIREKLAADFPAVPEYRSDLASSHFNLGILLYDFGKRAEAESAFRAALAIREKLAADFPAVPAYRSELATSHYNLGFLLAALGNRAGAESAYRAALAIQEKLAADFPAVPEYRSELAASHNNLGILLKRLGNRAGAESAYRAALAIREKLAADFPTVPRYRMDAAKTQSNLALLLARTGGVSEAVALAEKLIGMPNAPAGALHDCAYIFALTSKAPYNPAADAHAARAVALLRQAVAKGYADIPRLLADPDLAPLRGRADYVDLLWDIADMPAAAGSALTTGSLPRYDDLSRSGDLAMTPTLTAPDPTIFSADVLAFAAERGVTDYLTPLFELTKRCFPGAEVTVRQENDYEIAGLRWIVYDVAVYDSWEDGPRRAAYDQWIEGFVRTFPPDAREPFVLGMQ